MFTMAVIENKIEQDSIVGIVQSGYDKLFGEQWPVWVGGLLLGALNVFLFAFARPWSAADGVRNWGDWFYNALGIMDKVIISPHLYSTSVLNISIVIGALTAAMLSRQFAVRVPPQREFYKGLFGGCLMGVGSSLSFGCNIGGFFSASSGLSLAGIAMMLGLMLGAYIGLRLLLLEIEYLPAPVMKTAPRQTNPPWYRYRPLVGIVILVLAMVIALTYDGFDYSERAGIIVFGLVIGIVLQRTRFCFVRAFREQFMTGNSETTKAVAVAIIISVIGFSILKWTDLKEWEVSVSDGFWFGSLIGGTIFGIGMSLTGGCATGSLWRAGEGHVKLWIALIAFALSGSYFREWLEASGWIMKLGESMFLPDYMSWKMSVTTIIAIMLLWYLLAAWNEVRGKFVVG